MNIICPSCGSHDFVYKGKIPQNAMCATIKLDVPLQKSNLYKCLVCHLYFRWPRIDQKQLDKIYERDNQNHWNYKFINRKDWQIAFNYINNNFAGGSILDIACWNGMFLERFKENWELYGIEINQVAANNSLSRGVKIIGNSIFEMKTFSKKFDVITALDFIEHVENPIDLIAFMNRQVKNGGLIILSSGNTESITWKIMGSKYWYCSISEHLTFINAAWLSFVAKRFDLKLENIEKFSHARNNNLIYTAFDLIRNISYLIAPFVYGKLRKKVKFCFYRKDIGDIYCYPPSWNTSKDHILAIFRK